MLCVSVCIVREMWLLPVQPLQTDIAFWNPIIVMSTDIRSSRFCNMLLPIFLFLECIHIFVENHLSMHQDQKKTILDIFVYVYVHTRVVLWGTYKAWRNNRVINRLQHFPSLHGPDKHVRFCNCNRYRFKPVYIVVNGIS